MSVLWRGCGFTLLLIWMGLGNVYCDISDLRLCADPLCQEVISKGRTVIGYPSNDKQILSFPINAEVTVYSKEAGTRQDLWGVEIKGRRGYVPKKYIREYKVFKSKVEYQVPTSESASGIGTVVEQNALEENLEGTSEVDESLNQEERLTEEQIALSGEDVEYNNLKSSILEDNHKKGVDVVDESTIVDIQDNKPEKDGESEKQVYKGEILDDKEITDAVEDKEEEEDQDDLINETEIQNVEIEEEILATPEANSEGKSSEPLVNEHNSEDKPIENIQNNIGATDPVSVHQSEVLNDKIEASSPENFEVIDGTTVYFDDATPVPPTVEAVPPIIIMSSSVIDQDYATAHPPPLLKQPHFEDIDDQNDEIQATATISPVVSMTVAVESGNEVPMSESAPLEPTKVLPSENEVEQTVEVKENDISIEPSSSLLTDATETVSSWFGGSEVENKEPEESDDASDNIEEVDTNDVFRNPKPESIVDSEVESPLNVAENEGFFSSWFGSSESSEGNELLESETKMVVETKSDIAPENSEIKPEANSEIKPEANSENSNINTSNVEISDDTVSSESIPIPVEPTENYEVTEQPSTTIADVEITTLASVDESTEDPYPYHPHHPHNPHLPHHPPLDHHEHHSAVDSPDLNTSAVKEEESKYSTGNDEEPDTSTARPLYAVPEPTSSQHTNLEVERDDDMAHLAGDGAVSDESDLSDISLSDGLLKTSHNVWLTIVDALQLPEGMAFGFEAELAEPKVSSGMLVFLLLVAGTVIVIYFIHLLMMKISREGPLLEAMNRLDHDKRIVMDENDSLHAELVKAKSELENVSSRITESSGDVNDISSQLEMVKNEHTIEKQQLEERIEQLEHELEEATGNGLEMHKMLSEMLSSQKEASSFQASVDHLQSMLDGQREKVETLTSDLALKNRLNEELHNELAASMDRATKLDYQVEQLTHSLEELTGVKGEASRKLQEESALVEELRSANESLTQQAGKYDSELSTLNDELQDLRETITQLRDSVETKESELEVAKECLKQLRLSSPGDHTSPEDEKVEALFNVIKVKAELQKVSNERLVLVDQLQDAEVAQKNLEDTMSSIRTEVDELRTQYDVSVKEKQDAMSKLEVLTKYFEEKEAQLTKELECQEGLRLSAEGSASSVAKKIQNYDLELASYKTQVENLRKELEEQESSYKTQIANHEQKAHENWLQARAAERKHEEQRQENSQLRSRLTMIQKEKEEAQQSQVNIIKPTPKRVDANGTMSSPRPMVDGTEDHSLHHDLDSPPFPPHPMLPMMFPPGGPPSLPPGIPPPHGLPPGVPPLLPGLPHGVPPPPPPFLPRDPSFISPLPGDRRLPPAGGMSSPPFRNSGSPSYDYRNDRFSPISDRLHGSDRRTPPSLPRRPSSPDMHRNRSPDRRSGRMRSPDRRSDRMRSPDRYKDYKDRRSPDRRSDRSSDTDRYRRHRTSPRNYYDDPDYINEDSRLQPLKGKKTSTPLGPGDR